MSAADAADRSAALLRALTETARAGARLPSNEALMASLGYRTTYAVYNAMHRLHAHGDIVVERVRTLPINARVLVPGVGWTDWRVPYDPPAEPVPAPHAMPAPVALPDGRRDMTAVLLGDPAPGRFNHARRAPRTVTLAGPQPEDQAA